MRPQACGRFRLSGLARGIAPPQRVGSPYQWIVLETLTLDLHGQSARPGNQLLSQPCDGLHSEHSS